MKKILAIAVLALAAASASAQAYVGGSLGLTRNTTENETNFTIAPEVGYNLDSTWAIGATVKYSYTYNNGYKTNIGGIAPYARYTYFSAVDNRLNLFVDGTFTLGFGKAKYEDLESDTVFVWDIGFRPGVSFNITKNFGLVSHLGFLGYEGANDAGKASGNDEKFGFDFSSMNLTFGFYYNF